MTVPDESRRSGVPLRRLEAYSDGVFAIAATLLALDVGTDAIGTVTTNQELWEGLRAQRLAFIGVVVAFLVLCNLWAFQAAQLASLSSVTPRVLSLNAFRLLGVILVPFSTSVATHYDQVALGAVLLPLNILWIVTFGVLTSWHTRSAGLVEGPRERAALGAGSGLLHIGTAVGVVVLAPFVGMWAFLLFAVEGLARRLVGRRR